MDLETLNIALLAKLFLSHLVADFVFQTKAMVDDRFENKWRSVWLYVHGILAGMLAYLLSGAFSYFWLFIAYTLSHILIDGFKSTKKDDLKWFILDQSMHLVALLVVWALITGPVHIQNALFDSVQSGPDVWILMVAYTLMIWPAGILIGKFTEPWRMKLDEDSGLSNGGFWIGRLERFLLLTFIILDEYALVGLLIAAKSVLRFTTDRKASEYIVIGTLLSISITVIAGLAVKLLLGAGL